MIEYSLTDEQISGTSSPLSLTGIADAKTPLIDFFQTKMVKIKLISHNAMAMGKQ